MTAPTSTPKPSRFDRPANPDNRLSRYIQFSVIERPKWWIR